MSWDRLGGRKEIVAAVFLLAMAISHAVMFLTVLPSLRRGYQDFTIFYGAARMVRSGHAASLYDLDAQYRAQKEFAPDVPIRQAALPYNHPPFEALLFVPLTFVGYLPAYGIWTAFNVAVLSTSLALLRNQFSGIKRLSPVFLALGAAGFFPIALGVIQGQDSILMLLIVVLAMVALAQERDPMAGAILALGLFKFHFIVPLALVVATKRPRLLAGFAPVAFALAGVSVTLIGWDGIFDYGRFVLHLEKSGAGGAITAFGMPNLHGLVTIMIGAYVGSLWCTLLTLAGSAAVLAGAVLGVRKGAKTVEATFALATVVAILVSYHAMPYDLSLLFPSAVLLFAALGEMRSSRDRTDAVLLTLLFLTPLYVFAWLHVNRLGWFALVLLWLFLRLLRGDPPTAEGDRVNRHIGLARMVS